jgi:hypothetical protein
MQAVQVKPLLVLAAVLAAAVRSLTVMEAIKVKLAAAEAVAYCQVQAVLAAVLVVTVGMRAAQEATPLLMAVAAVAAGVLVAETAIATLKVAAVLVVRLSQVQPLLHTLTTAQFMDQQHEFYRAKI